MNTRIRNCDLARGRGCRRARDCPLREGRPNPWLNRPVARGNAARTPPLPRPLGRLPVSPLADQSHGAGGGPPGLVQPPSLPSPPGPRLPPRSPPALRAALAARWRARCSSQWRLLMPTRGGPVGAGPGAMTHGAVTQRDGGGGGGGGRCGRREGSLWAGEGATAVAVA